MSHDHPAVAMLTEFLSVASPSGREEPLASLVRARLDQLGLTDETDGAGNVTVRLPGRDASLPTVMLAAHTDEIAMVVTAIDDDGSLHVDRSGGLYPYKLGECAVEVSGDGEPITGVVSMGSTHTAGAATRQVCWPDVRIMTGLTRQQLAAAGIRPGSTATPTRASRGPVIFGDPTDPMIGAWTFDDRMGVVTLVRLLEAVQAGTVSVAHPTLVTFTVHEEGGCHGAKVAAHRERPEIFIAVDGCPVIHGPGNTPLSLDGRPATWSKDAKAHFDQDLVRDLIAAANEAGTEMQVAVYDRAFSDASAAYDCGAVPRVATVGHVRENSHGYEVARLSVFDNLLRTLERFVGQQHVRRG